MKHILTGYDHLLFLLGLLIVARGFVSALSIITSLTIAHAGGGNVPPGANPKSNC